MTVAIYPGTFDPLTLGHLDIINRISKLFDRVVVGIARVSTGKDVLFDLDSRMQMVTEAVAHLSNVVVAPFEGLTVRFAKEQKASVLVRGLRAVSDFDYEFMMSQMNKNLAGEIETMFVMAGLEFQFLSSSLVKEVARLGGDISAFVPGHVARLLAKKLGSASKKAPPKAKPA